MVRTIIQVRRQGPGGKPFPTRNPPHINITEYVVESTTYYVQPNSDARHGHSLAVPGAMILSPTLWLDAVGTPIAVQQKRMRHSEIRTSMNVYGDVVTNETREALSKLASITLV